MRTKTNFFAGNGDSGGPKRSKHSKSGHKSGWRKRTADEPLIEQPVADATAAVPCAICHHPVDPKRMDIHIARFHGTKWQ